MKVLEPSQVVQVSGGKTSTTTCTRTETKKCNASGTRCVTVSTEVCVTK